MVTIYPDRGGISPAGTPPFDSLAVVPTSASAAMATLSVPSGSTLVSWTLQYREAGSETWLDYATGITATTKVVSGLDAETSYEFRGDDVVLSSTTGTTRVTTGPAPATTTAYRVITGNLNPTENTLNSRPWGIIVENTGTENVDSIRITGRSTVSGHATILGAWIIGGTLSEANFQGTTWQRITFGGANTLTPGDGSREVPAFWASDRMVLSAPMAPGERRVIRVQTGDGNVTSSLDFVGTCRPHYGDLALAGLGDEGDYGSDLTHVQLDPASWLTGVNAFLASVELGYEDPVERPMAAAWGDSVVGACIQGVAARDGWPYACEQAMARGRVVSHGLPGMTVQTYCGALQAWLSSAEAALYDTVLLTPWSWNNLDTDADSMIAAVASTCAAIVAAGKRAVLWISVPSSLASEGYGNPTTWAAMRAWAQGSGYPLIETWQDVATGGTGPTIAAANTGDGVHLNVAGQSIQGGSLADEEEVIFT